MKKSRTAFMAAAVLLAPSLSSAAIDAHEPTTPVSFETLKAYTIYTQDDIEALTTSGDFSLIASAQTLHNKFSPLQNTPAGVDLYSNGHQFLSFIETERLQSGPQGYITYDQPVYYLQAFGYTVENNLDDHGKPPIEYNFAQHDLCNGNTDLTHLPPKLISGMRPIYQGVDQSNGLGTSLIVLFTQTDHGYNNPANGALVNYRIDNETCTPSMNLKGFSVTSSLQTIGARP